MRLLAIGIHPSRPEAYKRSYDRYPELASGNSRILTLAFSYGNTLRCGSDLECKLESTGRPSRKGVSGPIIGPSLARVILYVKDIPRVAAFYERFFGMVRLAGATEGWLELASATGGCTIALHQAARTQKSGAAVKLVFGVADVEAFVSAKGQEGLKFGAIHRVNGFAFANAKDPAGNSISVSSRGL